MRWLGNKKGKKEQKEKKGVQDEGFDRYLFTLHLSGVEDPLDAKPLWISRYAGGYKIKDVAGNRHNRLYTALNTHRALSLRDDPDFKEPVEALRVFSDVLILIPKKYWMRSVKSRGVELSIMTGQLQRLHSESFKGSLQNDRSPQYCIMPADNLADDEVVCHFGLSVFIPSEKDKQTADLNITYQQLSHPFNEWVFWENNRKIKRPVGLYEGQNYLQIAPNQHLASLVSPTWFDHQQGYFQVNLDRDYRRISENTDLHQLFDDGEFIKEDGVSSVFKTFSFNFTNRQKTADNMTLKILPTDARHQVIDDTYGEETDVTEQLRGLTCIFGAEPTVSRFYQLKVKAIALPRFDTGLTPTMKQWQLAFNCRGILQNTTEDAPLLFTGYREKSGVWLQRNDNQPAEQLPLPIDIHCDDNTYALKKSPLLDYHAFLELPQQLSYRLGEQETMLGREESATGIIVNMLDKADTVLMNNGQFYPYSLHYLGFSGEHIQLQRTKDTLHVQQASQSSPFYSLNKDYSVKQRFDPKSKQSGEVSGSGLYL